MPVIDFCVNYIYCEYLYYSRKKSIPSECILHDIFIACIYNLTSLLKHFKQFLNVK